MSYRGYAASPSCPAPDAGANTNRTSVTIGTTTTSYCYDNADQLISSATGGTTSTSYAYSERGDQTSDNGTTYTWDASDRVTTATTGGITVTSTYDAVDRLIQSASTASGSTTVRYAYAGYTSSPAAVLSTSGSILQQLAALPGGVTVTLQTSGNVWSYTNLQGGTTATTNDSGTLTAGPVTYGPWGNLSPGQTAPANTTGSNTLGAYAISGKLTNTATGTILLGARTSNPDEGPVPVGRPGIWRMRQSLRLCLRRPAEPRRPVRAGDLPGHFQQRKPKLQLLHILRECRGNMYFLARPHEGDEPGKEALFSARPGRDQHWRLSLLRRRRADVESTCGRFRGCCVRSASYNR
jgi:YD repeat-containing protein